MDTIYKEVRDPYGFVYITTNMVNGMRYLGRRKFSKDWQSYLGSGKVFKQAMHKYGRENFVRDIVGVAYTSDELNRMEYEFSVFLNVVESEDWYNLALGGGATTGWHPSDETRAKIGQKTKERLADPTNHPMYGKEGLKGENNPMFGISPKERMDKETYHKWYEEHIPYWKNSPTKGKHIWRDRPHPNLGRHMSEASKEILRQKGKERCEKPENCPMFGKHLTEETKNKMRESKIKNKSCCKPIYCPELDRYFYSSVEAAEILHIDASGIRKCCKGTEGRKSMGKHPDTGEPLRWRYATKEEYEKYEQFQKQANNN